MTGMTGIVVAGGSSSKAKTYLYNLIDDTWKRLGDLNRQRFGAGKLLPFKVTQTNNNRQN